MSETILHLKQEFDVNAVVSIHYFEYTSDFILKSEYHDHWTLLYVESGACEILSSKNESKPTLLSQGQLLLQAPREYFSFRAAAGTVPRLLSVGFLCPSDSIALLSGRIFQCKEQQQMYLSLFLTESSLNFSTRVDDCGHYYLRRKYNQPIGGEQMISTYLELLFISFLRQCSTPAAISPSDVSLAKSDSVLLNRITDYYADHIADHVSIEDVCREFSIGRAHLQRIFREQTGAGAIEYFCQMRISMAKQMIQENRMTLTETARALGYTSIQYFSKQFKKITGMPPSQYQESIRTAGSNPLCHYIDLEQRDTPD